MTAPQAVITITGTENTSKEYQEFKAGVRMFSEVKIAETQEGGTGSQREEIDKCSISVFPPLNPDHEEINLPHFMMKTLKLEGRVTEAGAEISGTDMVYNYEQILRQIIYNNLKPAYYLNRQFRLSCSLREQRFISNEFIETLTVIHPPVPGLESSVVSRVAQSHHQISRFSANLPAAHFLSQTKSYNSTPGPEQGNVVVVVVILSMGLLVTVLAVGIVRLRAAAASEQGDDPELELGWEGEGEGPNITVNPLEDSESRGAQCQHLDSDMEDGYSDEEMYDEYEEEEEEEEEEDEMDDTKERLAWDKDV